MNDTQTHKAMTHTKTETQKFTVWNDWIGCNEIKYDSFILAMEGLIEWNKASDLNSMYPKSNWTIEKGEKVIFKITTKKLNS